MGSLGEASNSEQSVEKAEETNLACLQQEIRDARELLEFAVAQGLAVDDVTMKGIKEAETYLSPGEKWPSTEVRFQFEKAYRDLVRFLAPITIETLRATSDEYQGPSRSGFTRRWHISDAKLWSRKLWFWILLCIVLIFVGDNVSDYILSLNPVDEESGGGMPVFLSLLKSLLPFLYGWLGALTYLLRSANDYIVKRTFDMNHLPEYYNRMLLGFISGGIILLLQVDPSKSGVAKISANALAFVVGYNTDYLFQTIERIATAIFPKVTLTVSPPAGGSAKPKPTVSSAVISLALQSNTLPRLGTIGGSITLPSPATAGVSVSLSISPADCTVNPATLTIPLGSSQASFTIDAPATAKPGEKVLTATSGSNSQTVTFTVS